MTAGRPVTQDWVHNLPMMQQSVLMTAVRGPDGIAKYHPVKMLLRWYRRCILFSAIHGEVLTTPHDPRGQSFTGPSIPVITVKDHENSDEWENAMDLIVTEYLRALDEMPLHFHLHFLHGAEIIGYHHPDDRIATWWRNHVYLRLVHDFHLYPESQMQMDRRLSDGEEAWRERADHATQD